MHASQYIIDTIHTGYKLLSVSNSQAPQFYKRNNQSALKQSDFVYQEFLRLEKLGCIKRVDSMPHIVNPVSCVFSK